MKKIFVRWTGANLKQVQIQIYNMINSCDEHNRML